MKIRKLWTCDHDVLTFCDVISQHDPETCSCSCVQNELGVIKRFLFPVCYVCHVPPSPRPYVYLCCGELAVLLLVNFIQVSKQLSDSLSQTQLCCRSSLVTGVVNTLPKPCVALWVLKPLIFPLTIKDSFFFGYVRYDLKIFLTVYLSNFFILALF